MDKIILKKLLGDVQKRALTVDQAMERMKSLPFEDLGFAKIDTHRALRKGFPEVIFCSRKTPSQVARIVKNIKDQKIIMATRAGEEIFDAIKNVREDAIYHPDARIVVAGKPCRKTRRKILVATAGTADIPVAEEAAVTAQVLGNPVERVYDIGVAGIHRLFANEKKLRSAHVLIVVAGMEGALPSIVGGIVDRPIIAVPTSVGYGAHFSGIAPLLTMLNSCAPGIAVVNIDNGFGAGYMASMINQNK